MKNRIKYFLIIICIIMALIFGWLYAYHHAKNTDNLPLLRSLQSDDLQDLVGYRRAQLISVWDEPDDTISVNQDVWNLEGEAYLVVTYDGKGKVKEAVFGSMLDAFDGFD